MEDALLSNSRGNATGDIPKAFDRSHIWVLFVIFSDGVERVPQRVLAENLQSPTSEPADHLNLWCRSNMSIHVPLYRKEKMIF
jgi:hypothetical protein